MSEGGSIMARFARWALWGAGLLAVAVFAMYALGPIDAFPGMRLGGTPSDPPAHWADVNDHDDIFIATDSFPPWVVRAWYAGTEEGLYAFAWREARWRRLIEATPEARVRIGDATYSVRGIPVDAKLENDAVANAYREKYSHYLNPEQYGQAMADAAAEVLDDARRNRTFQLLRLEPVE